MTEQSAAATEPKIWGYAAASTLLMIWSSWLVASRAGALSPLTIYDLAALRYGVSTVIVLPIVLYLKPWQTITLWRAAVITVLLGPIYILLVFGGFKFAPAAHGGIYMNGALPVVTLLISRLWLSEPTDPRQMIGALVVIVGVVLVVTDSSGLAMEDAWLGDGMFFIAALFFSAYMVVSRMWNVTIPQLLLCSSVLNAITYLPIWYLALPSEISTVPNAQLALQFIYQGIVPNLIGLLLVTYAVRSIGAATTSAFMAAVPGLGAALSFFILGERLGPLGWFALVLLTIGIALIAVKRGRPLPASTVTAPR